MAWAIRRAKGGESRIYPWGSEEPGARACWRGSGNDRSANGWSGTCPVMSHPQSASRHGLLDLAGNVWDWTSSKKGDAQELRGGSWNFDGPRILRASVRLEVTRTDWYNFIGLRCGL